MPQALSLDPCRFFPAEPATRRVAADLFAEVETLPIVSPHGPTESARFATEVAGDPTYNLAKAAYRL